jgi:very-short-patch-repair endonuclease
MRLSDLPAIAKIPAHLKRSPLEVQLAAQMDNAGLTYVSEHRFDPVRRWRLDFAFVPQKLAIEVEGGIWTGGRHGRGVGMEKDAEKYNQLTLMGWRLLRFTDKPIKSGAAVAMIQEALMGKAA